MPAMSANAFIRAGKARLVCLEMGASADISVSVCRRFQELRA